MPGSSFRWLEWPPAGTGPAGHSSEAHLPGALPVRLGIGAGPLSRATSRLLTCWPATSGQPRWRRLSRQRMLYPGAGWGRSQRWYRFPFAGQPPRSAADVSGCPPGEFDPRSGLTTCATSPLVGPSPDCCGLGCSASGSRPPTYHQGAVLPMYRKCNNDFRPGAVIALGPISRADTRLALCFAVSLLIGLPPRW